MSCFVVDKATPGYSVARVEEKLGQKASETCALAFEDMEVPEDQRIGAEGEGYRIALVHPGERAHRHRRAERGHGARGAGLRGAAMRKERQAFGGPIIEHPGGGVPAGGCQDASWRRRGS